MTDDVDRASAREAELLAEALYQQRRRSGLFVKLGQAGAGSGADCAVCGERIPQARRVAVPGCLYCVACQTAQERTR